MTGDFCALRQQVDTLES